MIMKTRLKVKNNFIAIKSIVIKNLKIKFRAYPYSTFIEPFITSMIFFLGAYLMYKNIFNENISNLFFIYSNTSDYLSYILIGLIVFIITCSTLINICSNLIYEMKSGTFQNIFMTGININLYLLANLIERVIISLLEISILLVITSFLGLKINYIDIFSIIVAIILSFIGTYNISIIVWALMIKFNDTNNILNLSVLVLNIICGINFPIQYLPDFLQKIGEFIPIKYSVDIFRSILINGQALDSLNNIFLKIFILDFLYTVISVILANKILKWQLKTDII